MLKAPKLNKKTLTVNETYLDKVMQDKRPKRQTYLVRLSLGPLTEHVLFIEYHHFTGEIDKDYHFTFFFGLWGKGELVVGKWNNFGKF